MFVQAGTLTFDFLRFGRAPALPLAPGVSSGNILQ